MSIKQFLSEFFIDFFSFDSRFFKTFTPLIFKPGKISKEYINGKRMQYVNPFKLYLNVTIVFFLLQGLFSTIDEYNITDKLSIDNDEIKSDTTFVANTSTDSTSTETLKQKLTLRMDSIFNTTNFLENFKNDSISKKEKDSVYNEFMATNIDFIVKIINNDDTGGWGKYGNITTLKDYTVNYSEKKLKAENIDYDTPSGNQISFNVEDLKSLLGEEMGGKINAFIDYDKKHKNATATQAMTDLNYKKTRWNAFYFKTAQNINKAKEDDEFLKSWGKSIVSKISIALFVLLPVFTLFLSLLYIRRKWNYTEHLVLVFNVQTVFFLLLIFFNIFDRTLDTDAGILIFIPLFLFYLYKALQNFYEQHWFKTLVKFFLLNTFYLILSAVGLVVVSFIAFIL
ncbi:DUF3667 domain-containing protein [Aureibaculum sp. 2210JD6-5]|uniref:DUF3667 domain-containing protein n=1 Tax=Aureibaculum sp. 2210JD6-5 TaxID=3103957 RepID=UPI002AAEFBBE|nr:DUF3667 domain-containing protein [Aureibaculum sp. 2210JD6-5]MDY7397018.1 DUF3667 domain-containing protein [Aureibaculum sp. 2210JD6-5]